MTKLVIYEEFDDEETIIEDFDLATTRILIGSGPDNELVLESPEVDPTHISLELRNEHWILQDLGGPRGTRVNGQIIDGPHPLQHDDLIELGNVKIRLYDLDSEIRVESSGEMERAEEAEVHISGRVWFAAIAGGTLVIIFMILLLMIIGDYLGLLKMTDLLPWV